MTHDSALPGVADRQHGAAAARIRRVGLTGVIASGKSAAARRFAELGAVVIDHDVLARDVLAPGSRGALAVAEKFGPAVMADDSTVNRAALGALVFTDDDARQMLESIVHPIVLADALAADRAAHCSDPETIVVHDIPLLVEAGLEDRFDFLVVVTAPMRARMERLAQRGLSEDEARDRVCCQSNDEARIAAADVVLDGGGTVANLHRQIDELWSRWR